LPILYQESKDNNIFKSPNDLFEPIIHIN